MSVSTKPRTARKLSQHSQPIYLVSFDGQTLTTNTENGRGLIAADGFPVQYRCTLNAKSGDVTCGCPGFQESIEPRAQRAGITPTLANGKACCHIRKVAQFGIRHGYIAAELAAPAACPVATQVVEMDAPAAAAFDWVSHFESM